MENEYNLLEERLMEGNISEPERLRILERQKELLLLFLADANKNIFNMFRTQEEDIIVRNINFSSKLL